MNREIKFRAWQDGEMLTMPITTTFGIYKFFGMLNDETPVMQATGIRDKNAIEIYEGDIYNMGDYDIKYVVVWHDTGLIGKQISSSSYAGIEHWAERIKITGNIYENPELIISNKTT